MRRSKGPVYQKFRDRHGVLRARASIPPVGDSTQRTFRTLGRYGTPESRNKFREIVAEWERAQAANLTEPAFGLTVSRLCAKFLRHAELHYRDADGKPTGEVRSYVLVFSHLLALHAGTQARDFGPLALKAVRQRLVDDGWVRRTINQAVGRLKRVWRWAASEQLVPIESYAGLATVAGLAAGRTKAPDRPGIQPADPLAVRRAYRHLGQPWRDMVHVQALTGMRPCEVCRLRADEIDQAGPVVGTVQTWVYRPRKHKTAWRGLSKAVVIGPRAQRILKPLLAGAQGGYLFRCRKRRRASPHATVSSYDHAIGRACKAASCEHWHPNQLRHSAATAIQQEAGLDGARAVLGHSDPKTTLIYAERDLQKAAAVIARLG